jgi:hypothetical protein
MKMTNYQEKISAKIVEVGTITMTMKIKVQRLLKFRRKSRKLWTELPVQGSSNPHLGVLTTDLSIWSVQTVEEPQPESSYSQQKVSERLKEMRNQKNE